MPLTQNKSVPSESYEHWDLAIPELSPRSVLYQIHPIGVGTAETECLTSYLARVALAHHLPVGALLARHLFPVMSVERAKTGRPMNWLQLHPMYYANGADNFAVDLVGVVEGQTLVTGIAATTFVLWRDVVSRLEWLRRYRAWCSDCYAEQSAGGGPVYDLLLWTVVPVKICPRHLSPLIENCPSCGKRIGPIRNFYLPGFCSYCQVWLGAKNGPAAPNERTVVADAVDYDLWVIDNIGAIIAASPTLLVPPARQNVITSVNHCCNLLMEGNARMFARLLGAKKATPRSWLNGEAIPPFKALAKLSYWTKIPLLKLLTEPDYVLEYLSKHPVEISGTQTKQIRHLHRRTSLGCQKVREQMEAALEEIPSPSLAEVARRLGYRTASTLRAKFPELSKKINANHMSTKEFRDKQQSWRLRASLRPDKETQGKMLEQELEQSCPESVHELARGLGYACHRSLTKSFPDLCQALIAKRREYLQQQSAEQLSRYRQTLETALREDPPPPLNSVVRRFEGVGITFFREHFPQECQGIASRYIAYRKKRMQEAEENLRRALQETAPQRLKHIAKQAGYCSSSLIRRYPELCRSILDRYERHLRELAAKKKKADLRDLASRLVEA